MSQQINPSPFWSGDRRDFIKTAAAVPMTLAAAQLPAAEAPAAAAAGKDAPLPPGVKAVWELALAQREATPTRERICINGLWRWQPAQAAAGAPPEGGWGFFKVPGCWPGITDYMQKDSQTLHAHPAWGRMRLRELNAAWYQREIEVPREWDGRRITLTADVLNSFARVFIDGKAAGEMRFPGGELDLSAVCRPGSRHVLTLCVETMPLNAVLRSYIDTGTARDVRGKVERRGLCGDVFLEATPAGARISDVKIETSVRQGTIALDAELQELAPGKRYRLGASATEGGREAVKFASEPFTVESTKEGRIAFTHPWRAEKLWDIHTPQHQYDLHLTLLGEDGQPLDAALPIRFGFREFWIEGRDFFLNGSRIFLSVVPIDNAQVGAYMATYAAARETLARIKSFGINAVYTHNYGCQPGDHLAFGEILRAADDEGVLVSFSQPHFSHYDWKAPDAATNNGYARHAAYYVRMAQHHPAVVMYSMNHNSCGYSGDMDPNLIDGIHDNRDTWASNNLKRALQAEAIVKHLDPARIVYHHAGGNVGAMHTINFYPNFVPIQEMSDWFEHWATTGVKPAFTCEFGAPFTWDWAMYRGWYKGERTFGSARVPWEFCLAEWNAQFFGDSAFRISEAEKANLRWEAKKFQSGQLWFRWDYPHQLGSSDFTERDPVWARYIQDNWRAFRTWGLSANSPWEYSILWRVRPGVDKGRRELKVDWDHLQRPGISPDFVADRYEKVDAAFERTDWVPGAGALALIQNNKPLLAYLAGGPERFTSKAHNFVAGEAVEKQIVLINNSRQAVTCQCEWSFGNSTTTTAIPPVKLETGRIERLPVHIPLPIDFAPGARELRLKATFSTGEVQQDALTIHVLPSAPRLNISDTPVALFDPQGETTRLLGELNVKFTKIEAGTDPGDVQLLVIGKGALSATGAAPDLARVRDGLKVIVFEQTAEALEQRLGFRVQEYGLRQLFPRLPDHPVLEGLRAENLCDWRGASTLTPPSRSFTIRDQRLGATVKWCDIPVTRLWRCGNHGNVASVLIEKPACGNFMPLVDGGFSLQYSPLMEYREGKGVVLFCQMDVTGRTTSDPAGKRLVGNLLRYAAAWKPAPESKVVYCGDPAGKAHLEKAGFAPEAYGGGSLAGGQVLVVGPGGGQALSGSAPAVRDCIAAGTSVLALGLDADEVNALLPQKVSTERREHIATVFDPPARGSLLAGIGPADVHNRAPRAMPLVTGGAAALGDGVLAQTEKGNVVFCQMAPWQFDAGKQSFKRTFRRASFAVTRILGNMGVAGATPLLERFGSSVTSGASDGQRWLHGLYLDQPEEWDDPYRSFRW